MEDQELGLRERKKQRTRQTVSDVATGLFIQRGFDNVTVAEVAKAADVSVNTVFNYFSTKEELFLDWLPWLEQTLCNVVRDRESGESAVAAVRRNFLVWLEQRDYRSGLTDGMVPYLQTVEASPALMSHLRQGMDRMRRLLADRLMEETDADPDDIMPRVVAGQIQTVFGVLHEESRRRLMAGEQADEIYPDMAIGAKRAFDSLESGIGDYCVRES